MDKVLAIFGRTEPRDFADLMALEGAHPLEELFDLAGLVVQPVAKGDDDAAILVQADDRRQDRDFFAVRIRPVHLASRRP